jgi:Zn finger protein HypA/HybF involved in hydrogenase expression
MTVQCVCQSCRHRWTVPFTQPVYCCPKCGGKNIMFEYAQVEPTPTVVSSSDGEQR